MKNLLAVIALVVGTVSTSPAADFTPLKDGDRVVFFGDSITAQRHYTTYLEQYVRCRYPDLQVRFFNAGWNGDTAAGALARMGRDVLPLKPTVVTIFFGMNDGGYIPPDDAVRANYRDSMDKLVTALQAANIRVIVFGPGCVDEDRQARLKHAQYNKTLAGLSEAAKEVAAKHGCLFIDIHNPMLQFQTEQKKKNPDFTMSIDGIHPTDAGHVAMSRWMLPALAEPGIEVTTDKTVAPASADAPYTITTRAVPFWVPDNALAVARDSGLLDFAAAKLTVPELPEGNFLVSIDDAAIGNLSALQLATGIPIPAQASARAQRLHALIEAKGQNYNSGWRFRLSLPDAPSSHRLYDAMMQTDEEFNAAISDLLQNTKSSISLWPEPLGQNLALNKPYTSSDPNGFGWNSGLTDGSWDNVMGHCFATGVDAAFPKSVTIDLKDSSPIGAVAISVPPFGSTKTVSVSVSPDGKTFTDIGSHTFLQKQFQHYVFTAPGGTRERYIRLTYQDHYADSVDYPSTFAFTTEAEVYPEVSAK
jgi:lysophospholipase L1-like esterase